MKKILLIATSALLAYLALVWFTPSILSLHDARRWILRGSLSLIGLLAGGTIVWFFWNQRKQETAAEEPADAGLSQTDIDLLVREANAKLAAAGLGRIGTLPVVLFVGAPGSAKTSTVVNCGLNPELLAGRVHRDNVIAPTAVANLWFARRAVLADVGGPVLADAGHWEQLIRRLRPAKLGAVVGQKGQAPRAFVVCVDIEALARETDTSSTARNLRRRLAEFAQALGIHLPTYVLFTRMDRIPFFTEYVRNLNDEEASQVLGATLPMVRHDAGIYAQQAGAQIASAFDELYRSLCRFRPEYLEREHDAVQLPGIYEFPREARKLRRPVVDFLTELCRPSELATGPFLRGFYFSGVRPVVVQENAPYRDRAPAQQPSAVPQDATAIFRGGFGGPQPAPAMAQQVAGSRRVPQWVFVTRFFQKVVLEDRLAMGASAASTKASLLRRVLLVSATVLCLGLSVAFLFSYAFNRSLENRVKQAASGILTVQPPAGAVPAIDSLRRLESLRESLQVLAQYNREGAPWRFRWGLYAGDDLYPDVRRLYFNAFAKLLLAYTQGRLLDDLRQLPAPPAQGPAYQPTYDTLKAYLITTSHPQHSTKEFLSPLLLSRWRQNRPSATAAHAELAQKQFDFYSQELAIANPLPRENDRPVTAHAQRYLRSFGDNRRIYQQIVANASKANEPVNFNRKFSGSAAYVVESYEVPGAFTKAGWEFLKKQLVDPTPYYSGDDWVLGDQKGGQIDRAQLEQDVQRWYPEDLLTHWRNYARGASVVKFEDFKDAAQKLGALSAGNQSPLVALFWVASQHTTPDVPAGTEAFRPFHAVAAPGVADTLAPATEAYVRALSALQISVDEVAKNANSDAAKLQVQTDATAALKAMADVRNRFGMNADRLISEFSRKLLEDPIVNVTRLANDLEPAALNKKGKGLCDQFAALWRKYPFNANATAQATLPEVNALLRKPDGALWKLYNESLQKALVKKERYERTQETINPRFVDFFNRAAAFSEAIYPQGAQDPLLTFSLKPVPTEGIQNMSLRLDGQTQNYAGGAAAATQFTWQGSGVHEARATVRFGGSTDLAWSTNEGLWAIFQFFGKAERWQSRNTHLLEWIIRVGNEPMRLPNGSPLTVRYELDMGGNPPFFQKGYFSGMSCVAEIAR